MTLPAFDNLTLTQTAAYIGGAVASVRTSSSAMR